MSRKKRRHNRENYYYPFYYWNDEWLELKIIDAHLKKNFIQQWSNPSSKMIANDKLSSIFGQILLGTIHKQSWIEGWKIQFCPNQYDHWRSVSRHFLSTFSTTKHENQYKKKLFRKHTNIPQTIRYLPHTVQ